MSRKEVTVGEGVGIGKVAVSGNNGGAAGEAEGSSAATLSFFRSFLEQGLVGVCGE